MLESSTITSREVSAEQLLDAYQEVSNMIMGVCMRYICKICASYFIRIPIYHFYMLFISDKFKIENFELRKDYNLLV
jgi:hypothetical protein